MRDPTTSTVLYKILTPQEKLDMPDTNWAGTALDTKDGFIHLSSADQLPGTLERFFGSSSGCGDVLYIYTFTRSSVDRQRSTPIKLQFDPAAGTVFGHIYGVSDSRPVLQGIFFCFSCVLIHSPSDWLRIDDRTLTLR
ncbi:hypothetical protein PHSY_003073 [Pseudozyma hubeiensis SY62]|uniref:DUF952 domain-containing protein n=1 Tax=Pseudozyma hubeiensis (strain SY62) TaxID=1305764 RepID=R9P2P3_PSEHS|nr:hypothetical protein PHSY_003073 [Pseudozyma hubeiensis SY62]GAC95497.1 hypothetical protein PHSY_003073 [Pseudozyma hubeiensis SY62]